jgi:NADP-dependent 3-hydroxy acid dehydrogenase YdfG
MALPVVVITGSTRGIGLGMTRAFLDNGCRAVVSGRDQERVGQAVETLAGAYPVERIMGHACDVAEAQQVQDLWDASIRRFRRVDTWINNAAVGSIEQDFWEHDPDTIRALIETNVIGSMYGARVAARGMVAQGGGQIYMLEGWGSGNEMRRGSTLYGASKAAIRYFTRSLAAELRATPVRLGSINPGLVPTELLALSMRHDREANIKRFINIFGDRVETVAPALVRRVLANRRHNARIVWLSPLGMLGRLVLAPFRQRRIID